MVLHAAGCLQFDFSIRNQNKPKLFLIAFQELMGKQNLWVREGDARVAIADLLESVRFHPRWG